MKTLGFSLAALLAASGPGWGQASSQAPAGQAAASPSAAPADAAKAAPTTATHKINAEVVATDVERKTITVKVNGAEKTSPVGPLAMYRLKKLRAGDKVVLTYRDAADGAEHQEVSFIRMQVPEAAASPAPGEK